MQRDMDLIRELMFKLEILPLGSGASLAMSPRDKRVAVDGYDTKAIEYHLDQIRQSGFIDSGGFKAEIGIGFRCLTPAGHDFIDSVRNVDAWKATKERAGKLGGFTVGILADLAKAWLRAEAGKLGWM